MNKTARRKAIYGTGRTASSFGTAFTAKKKTTKPVEPLSRPIAPTVAFVPKLPRPICATEGCVNQVGPEGLRTGLCQTCYRNKRRNQNA